MEKIKVNNYEDVYLDYLEGNLNEQGIVMLFDFLNDNPALKEELEDDADVIDFTLNPNDEKLTFFEKEDLKHFDCKSNEICLNNVDDFIVAEVEGEITQTDKTKLDAFIIEHDLKSRRDYFYSTKLRPNLKEIYPNKSELKKRGAIIPLFIKISSVAAVGLIMFSLFNRDGGVEIYQPRQNNFALEIDSSGQIFNINKKENSTTNLVASGFSQNNSTSVVKEKDTLPSKKNDIDILPNQFVDMEEIKNDKKVEDLKEKNFLPKEEIKNNDLALNVEAESISKKPDIKLIDMYQPVTNLANNYTDLALSYKKSTTDSDYKVTTFSIGKFSFERKKKR